MALVRHRARPAADLGLARRRAQRETAANTDDYSMMLRNWSQTSDRLVDWVRVRALATPEPTVTLGTEAVLK